MKEIYIIYLVDINLISDTEMRLKFDYHKKKYGKKDMTFEEYVRLMTSWNRYPYHFVVDPEGYYDDYEAATRAVKNNVYDINESGSYPYAVIASMPINRIYPQCDSERKFELFEYDDKTNKYIKIDWNRDDFWHLLTFAKNGGM